MAISPVQKYLNNALSLIVSNKSGTDAQYTLPNDFRKLTNLKIKDYSTRIETYAGSLSTQVTLGVGSTALTPNFALYIFSHPVYVYTVFGNATSSTRTTYPSIFLVGRDQVGQIVDPSIIFINKLDKTDSGLGAYQTVATDVANTTEVTVLEFLAEIEA
tara:strand:+ start:139 stop:615 length:477 start_codon:yes stop_codon:yes gene_type:complete